MGFVQFIEPIIMIFYNNISNFIESIYSQVKKYPEDYSLDLDFSSIKGDNIKKMNTYQITTKQNEYEKN